ncbi:TIGR00282 family metallophosphoesterase [Moorella sulfitireducens (nom. illeg.)]|uniref:TIGR00282 family metallophosphoesterase n=1 Tax=Neomoorella sulfitireducens TaxID=2972948 RepID=UPI0021ABA26B|nr:TIGR00282 family metallophosphoesterase [Moorella sulfitireducens]
MRVLMIGDIVGRPGRKAIREILPPLLQEYRPDLVVANGENAAGGNGITADIAGELLAAGIDILTMGNHVWDKREALALLDEDVRIIRPANYPPGTPGRGHTLVKVKEGLQVGIINLSGRVFLSSLECPFRLGRCLAEKIGAVTRIILVDFHAEATSEKVALGWYLDGLVSAVIGTHTHIQTADARVLPGGTAYITDVGMTGPRDSVLGVKTELVIKKFLTQLPVRFEVAGGTIQLEAVLIDIDPHTGRAEGIQRLQRYGPV